MHQHTQDLETARRKISLPANLLAIAAGVSCVCGLLQSLAVVGFFLYLWSELGAPDEREAASVYGVFGGGVVGGVVCAMANGVVLVGALAMRRLKVRSLAYTAAIVALLPCGSICCIATLPLGAWALLVLSDPVVSRAFAMHRMPPAV